VSVVFLLGQCHRIVTVERGDEGVKTSAFGADVEIQKTVWRGAVPCYDYLDRAENLEAASWLGVPPYIADAPWLGGGTMIRCPPTPKVRGYIHNRQRSAQ